MIKLNAHAKINLFLKVGSRRRDGYHSIHTVFQEISLHDILIFKPIQAGLKLKVQPRGLSGGPSNLVIKALRMLQEKMKTERGMSVKLIKKNPIGAGLGGGSSDAATALWAGWYLWQNKKIPNNFRKRSVPTILSQCAKKLGADVSFFLKGGKAIGRGRGERLQYLKQKKIRWLILIYPRVHVSTAKAYEWLDQIKRKGIRKGNDFENVVLSRFPKIQRARKALVSVGCEDVLLSGSGSSVFGFVSSKPEGKRILKKIKKRYGDAFLAHTV